MNSANLRAAQIKEVRRGILDALKLVYPAWLSFISLRMTLPEVEEGNLRKDVAYLLDKGYLVRVEAEPNEKWDARKFRLSGDGVEVADRIERDPALEP